MCVCVCGCVSFARVETREKYSCCLQSTATTQCKLPLAGKHDSKINTKLTLFFFRHADRPLKTKPQVVADYNQYMLGVDKLDQMGQVGTG